MNNSESFLFKIKSFPEVSAQIAIWNNLFPGIGEVDPGALNHPVPDQTVRVCFPRISYLAEGRMYIYAIQRIKDALKSYCKESGIPFWDDCDFFFPETLLKEEQRIKDFELRFDWQKSNLIVAPVQFWMLHPGEDALPISAIEIPMSVSHATELLRIVQGCPGNLWKGYNQDSWFSCPGSPSVSGGIPCFDFYGDALCLTPFGSLGKSKGSGGAASIFVQ